MAKMVMWMLSSLRLIEVLVFILFVHTSTVSTSSVSSHVELSAPLHGSVVAPGTNVMVAYKVSQWFINQQMKGACLIMRVADDPERGEPQVMSCIEGIQTFGIVPNAPGVYEISVEAWTSDGDRISKHMSQASDIIVREDENFDVEGYGRKEGFRMIYEFGHWGEDGGRSGDGSSLEGSNSDSHFLLQTLSSLHVRSLFDAGCGALAWQPSLLDKFHTTTGRQIRYHGADIVPDVVRANQEQFGDNVTMSFSELDIALHKIPTGFDMILCRHALFHNTNTAVLAILKGVSGSGASWFVATTLRPIDPFVPTADSEIVNGDVEIGTDGRRLSLGGYRPVELEMPPFCLPPPLRWGPERGFDGNLKQEYGRQRGLAVWSLPFREAPGAC